MLKDIVNRFPGSPFALYGGTEDDVSLLQDVGTVTVWFTTIADATSIPVKQRYDRLLNVIYDAIYVIHTHGNMGRNKVETSIMNILRDTGNTHKIVILEGYTDFISTGLPVVTEQYDTGTVVGISDGRVSTLHNLLGALNRQDIKVPVPMVDIQGIPGIEDILPYLHLTSRIEAMGGAIPITDSLPTDILPIDDPTMKSDYVIGTASSARNWGQRKLLVSEIELLTKVYEATNDELIIIYVGSAPGTHIERLADMFAQYLPTFHLWDRRDRFNIQESESIRIIPDEYLPDTYDDELLSLVPESMRDRPRDEQLTNVYGFFTEGVMRKYMEAGNEVVLISDIRDDASDTGINQDMLMQQQWVQSINPIASLLKFRLPVSMAEDGPYQYLQGDIRTQAWARDNTLETRLLSMRPYTTTAYDITAYTRSMAYFNAITRLSSYDQGKTIASITDQDNDIGRHIPMPEDGLCTCHDCTREVQVVTRYLQSMEFPITMDSIKAEIQANTMASRLTRNRTLWSQMVPRVPPSDRRILILYQGVPSNMEELQGTINTLWSGEEDILLSDEPIDSLKIQYYSTILAYGDGYRPEELVSMLGDKVPMRPMVVGASDDILQDVLNGASYPILVNFHTDLVSSYNPQRDTGTLGTSQYRRYLQNMAIARQTGTLGDLSPLQHLLLFTMNRRTTIE